MALGERWEDQGRVDPRGSAGLPCTAPRTASLNCAPRAAHAPLIKAAPTCRSGSASAAASSPPADRSASRWRAQRATAAAWPGKAAAPAGEKAAAARKKSAQLSSSRRRRSSGLAASPIRRALEAACSEQGVGWGGSYGVQEGGSAPGSLTPARSCSACSASQPPPQPHCTFAQLSLAHATPKQPPSP